MKVFRSRFLRPAEGKSILFDVIARFLLTALVMDGVLTVGLLLLSVVLSEGTDGSTIRNIIGIGLFSEEYFIILGIVSAAGVIASAAAALLIGLPFGKALKTRLMDIRDANEIFSRGRLDHRLEIRGYIELEQIADQFNKMAQRTEKQIESLQRLVSENKDLLQGAEEAASTEERRKIARELHDAISQQLFAISTTLAAVPLLMDSRPEEARRYIGLVAKMVTSAQQELRALIMHLRPVNLEGHCLREGISGLLDEIRDKTEGIQIRQELGDAEGISPGIENNIFRVTQEAISNILRHSKATAFSVKLFQRDKVLVLIIEDNGIGMDLSETKKTSYGIETMRERIEEIGGRFDILSYPQKGTRIEIRVPVGLQGIFRN
ncbi:MAG: sensor histidine kinase [Saccharofermentanales bacterium]